VRPKQTGTQSRPLADRVQRIVDGDLPILHLEPEVPTGSWAVHVDGLVERAVELQMDDIHALGGITRVVDLHCVWGWSRPDCRWEGVHLNALTTEASPLTEASYVLITARSSPYASCLTLQEARDGLFAWRVDGRDLKPERGWPLRFVSPAYKWAYKSVKWVERITFLDEFSPGFWEERVGDPKGDVPWDVLERFQGQAQAWRKGRR
jgi:DMSO/TMAO reductase YedYZ molybdopterin-dependent catalytic subunit